MSNKTFALQGHTNTSQAARELVDELDQVRKEYAKSAIQISQQETLINHLKDVEAKKDIVIEQLEDELKNAQTLHEQEMAVAREEAKTAQLEAEHRIRYLELEAARLKEENAIFQRFESENREVRMAVIQQQEQIERLQRMNEELRSRARDDLNDYRSQLEDEFKRRLTESERKFQAEAYRALSEEAKIALQGNDHLQTILQKQNDSIEGVLTRCKALESTHAKMKMEQELSLQSIELHQKEVHQLRKQLSDSKVRCSQLEESLKQRRVERASLELLYMEYESTRKELNNAQEDARKAKRAAERWKQRLLAAQSGDGSIQNETGPLSSRAGSSRQAKRGKKLFVKKGWESDRGWTTDEETHAQPQPDAKVDPMELLSLWNVNFEGWRPAEGSVPSYTAAVLENLQADPSTTATLHANAAAERAAEVAAMAAPPEEKVKAVPKETILAPSRPRRTNAEVERAERDKGMSVLSRKKFKSLPPGTGKAVQAGNTGISYATKSSTRFLVP